MNHLFDFTFQNPQGVLLALVPAFISLVLLFYILAFLPKNKLTNIFALFTFTVLGWQLNDSLGRMIVNAADADFWDSLFGLSWEFVGPLALHFALLYNGILKKRYSRLLLLIIYAPAFIFMSLYQLHIYPHHYTYSAFWGWVNYHNKNIIDIIQINWIAALVVIAAILLFRFTYKVRHNKLLKNQSLIIATGIAIPTIAGIIGQVLLPIAFHRPAIPVASTFMTFFSLATVVALKKYKLFSVIDLVSNEALIESLPVIIFSIAEKERITYMNRFGRELLQMNYPDISRFKLNELFTFGSKKDENNFYEGWQKAFAGEEIKTVESSLITPRGKINLLLSCNPIVNNNQIMGTLFVARDITELKKSNQLMIDKEAMLEEAQQLAHIGNWEWDLIKDNIIWSDELYRIYGYAPGEIFISYNTYLQHQFPEERDVIHKILQQAIQDQQPFNYHHHINKKDGSIAIIHAQGKITTDDQNKAIIMRGTGQDVTERKTREEILQRQNDELIKINSELDRFVYSVSHDLRAPLTSVLGIVEISEDETQEPVLLNYLSMIKESIKKLDHFILDILDYSRNSRTETKIENINLKALLDEVLFNLKFINGRRHHVDIKVHVNEQSIFRSDKQRLTVILNNLVSNAIRYSNPNLLHPCVEICAEISSNGLSMKMSDNGVGIRKELQDKIFEMFYRASEISTGSGLGLYIVKETVQKLKGNISVESELGKGSIFNLFIPNQQ